MACRPATIFSGNFFKTPAPWPVTPSHRYDAAPTAAVSSPCLNNNMNVKDRRRNSLSDLQCQSYNLVRHGSSLSLLDIPNADNTDTLIPTITPALEPAPHNTQKMANAPTTANNNQEHMDTSTTTIHLSTCYCQTRNAHRALNNHISHNLDNGSTSSTPHSTAGNFNNEHNIQQQYLASRNNQHRNLHHNIACSFDPSNKMCTSCNTQHNIQYSHHTTTHH